MCLSSGRISSMTCCTKLCIEEIWRCSESREVDGHWLDVLFFWTSRATAGAERTTGFEKGTTAAHLHGWFVALLLWLPLIAYTCQLRQWFSLIIYSCKEYNNQPNSHEAADDESYGGSWIHASSVIIGGTI